MKCLNRNKQGFWYAPYLGKQPVVNEDGYLTGEYAVQYGKPVPASAPISPAYGDVVREIFGTDESYDKMIVMADEAVLDEHSLLWIDSEPLLDSDGNLKLTDGEADTPHDYIVRRVARSLNAVSYAVSKVMAGG